MKQDVILTIRGRQFYEGQDPDTIELVTEGSLEKTESDAWVITYEESDLTGLRGTKTTFRIQPQRVTLGRTGGTHSYMVFQEGVSHESLYRVDAGALLMRVCASKIRWDLSEQGGRVSVVYAIVIEESARGTVDYEILVEPKKV